MTVPAPIAPAKNDTVLRRFRLVAVFVPIVLTLVSLIVQLVVLPRVPATIAIHWGATGQADGFGPAWTQPVISVVVGLGIPLLLALTSLPGLRRGDRGPTYRLMGAVTASISALAAVLFVWTLVAQIDLTDAADAPTVFPGMLLALGAALVVGIGAWLVQPNEPARSVSRTAAPEMTLTPGEQVAWFGEATMGRAAVIIMGVTCALMAGLALVLWAVGAPIVAAIAVSVAAIVLVLAAATSTTFRVRADAAGLSVVSIAGFPRFLVPLSEIESVRVSDVSPMGEFGGWGIRKTIGAFGIVVRRGPAIDVLRTSGQRFVVTVDDAARGAAVLEALLRRGA